MADHDLTATNITVSASVGTPALSNVDAGFDGGAFEFESFQVIYVDDATCGFNARAFQLDAFQIICEEIEPAIPSSIRAQPYVDSAAISQNHSLTGTGVSVAPEVGFPALSEIYNFASDGLTVVTDIAPATITQVHNLTAVGVTVSSSVGDPAISQVHSLAANGVTAETDVGSPDLWRYNLEATGLTVAPSVGAPDMVQTQALFYSYGGPPPWVAEQKQRELQKREAEERAAEAQDKAANLERLARLADTYEEALALTQALALARLDFEAAQMELAALDDEDSAIILLLAA